MNLNFKNACLYLKTLAFKNFGNLSQADSAFELAIYLGFSKISKTDYFPIYFSKQDNCCLSFWLTNNWHLLTALRVFFTPWLTPLLPLSTDNSLPVLSFSYSKNSYHKHYLLKVSMEIVYVWVYVCECWITRGNVKKHLPTEIEQPI